MGIIWSLGDGVRIYGLSSGKTRFIIFSAKEIAKNRRIGVLSFGGLVLFGLSIPVFNLIVAPAAVIGATIYLHGIKERSRNNFDN